MNRNQKLQIYKYFLDSGKIDEDKYKDELYKLKNSKIRNSTLEIKLMILIVVIFITAMAWNIHKNSINKEIVNIDNFYNIPSPIQIKTSGKIIKKIDNTDVEIKYVASYILAGRVVDVQEYFPSKIPNKLSQRDIGVTWGYLAREEYNDRINWYSHGDRFLRMRTKDDGSWINKMGGVTSYFSNNHLIPADDEIEKQIKQIKVGDFIKIEGYLSNIYFDVGKNGYYTWNSSTSRTDSGGGACEIIYVTKINWLEEN